MGWWKMDCGGGISTELPTSSGDGTSPPMNAIPGRDTTEDHYNGDGPADSMGAALNEIARQYKLAWGRWPHLEELRGVFDCCMGPHLERGRYMAPGE